MDTYFVYLIFAMVIGFALGMMFCRHIGDVNHSVGELIIGEPDDKIRVLNGENSEFTL